jgi:hypothetical protein
MTYNEEEMSCGDRLQTVCMFVIYEYLKQKLGIQTLTHFNVAKMKEIRNIKTWGQKQTNIR